ncbi:hypothetical protein DPMN_154245 [Dreissena polymorpha]|uniref:Uncharacterized protein n=1 Tax=Dreissena polymorpha TaxID=45954 RepID=A0A9D4FN30_DREPO|nr:hypothetical protein DPMN_154245 [Dreissena polymorpha]
MKRPPGQCDNICNAVFVVNESAKRRDIGFCIFEMYFRLDKDMGYRAGFVNLACVSHDSSGR